MQDCICSWSEILGWAQDWLLLLWWFCPNFRLANYAPLLQSCEFQDHPYLALHAITLPFLQLFKAWFVSFIHSFIHSSLMCLSWWWCCAGCCDTCTEDSLHLEEACQNQVYHRSKTCSINIDSCSPNLSSTNLYCGQGCDHNKLWTLKEGRTQLWTLTEGE